MVEHIKYTDCGSCLFVFMENSYAQQLTLEEPFNIESAHYTKEFTHEQAYLELYKLNREAMWQPYKKSKSWLKQTFSRLLV